MGCGTALHAALLAPERIEALLLVIPPTAWETRRERADTWAQVSAVIEAKGVEPFIATTAAMPEPDPFVGRPERRQAHERHLRATDPMRLAGVFRGAATADLPPRDAIRTIAVPTQILAWSGDPAPPETTATQLGELMPQAQLSVARTWDELQTWTERVGAFLATLPHPAR
jgi:pimeloyl-ACP methyl ester carboxylesterase